MGENSLDSCNTACFWSFGKPDPIFCAELRFLRNSKNGQNVIGKFLGDHYWVLDLPVFHCHARTGPWHSCSSLLKDILKQIATWRLTLTTQKVIAAQPSEIIQVGDRQTLSITIGCLESPPYFSSHTLQCNPFFFFIFSLDYFSLSKMSQFKKTSKGTFLSFYVLFCFAFLS